MYPYPPATAELIHKQMQEALKGHGAKDPIPEDYWCQPQPAKPKWSLWNFWRKPKLQTEEVFEGNV